MSKILSFLLILIIVSSCKKTDREYTYDDIDFKEEMRNFVVGISQYAKNIKPDFIVVPQNGVKIISQNGETTGQIHQAYMQAIDGQGQEGLFYGYEQDDVPTPNSITNQLKLFLDTIKNSGKTVLVTDYCYSPNHIRSSYEKNDMSGYIGFAATQRELDLIPAGIPVHHVNNNDIVELNEVQNFLYLLNPHNFPDKNSLITALQSTNYDLIIMDMFFEDGTAFSPQQIESLKQKANGGQRLVISYISIGEAETYRYYWKPEWNTEKPIWLDEPNPDWTGNYKVRYWEKDWQNIIYGNNQSYIKKIIDAGFDGAYLDIIDAFEFFEDRY